MSSLADDLLEPNDEVFRARNASLSEEVGRLRKVVKEQQANIDRLERIAEYSGRSLHVPKWILRVPKKDRHVATICANLSDTHYDEVVNPSEMSGQNAYDRDIAVMRTEAFFTGIVKLARHHWAGTDYDGVCLFLTGDILSGIIHEELDATNTAPVLESVLFWAGQIAAGIQMLADEFGAVHVPCVVGNHARQDRKPRAKEYVRRNFEWLLYQLLAQQFDKDERVTFAITDDIEQPVDVHGARFVQYHGMAGGGQGIGGIFPPLMRLVAKLHNRWGAFTAMAYGHYHQNLYAPEQGLLGNGALKGYDEFARWMHFRPERPSQMVWLVTPEHGCTWNAPVFVADQKREGW